MKLTRVAATAGIVLAAGLGGLAVAGPAVAYPAGVAAQSSISTTVFTPGGTVSITVTNTTPGNATMQIFSAPVRIGGGVVGANGTGTITGTIPAGYTGAHTIQVVGAGGEIFSYAINIAGGASTGGSGSSSGGGGLANTGAAVTGIGILGGVLVAGGVFFVVAGRRRNANSTSA